MKIRQPLEKRNDYRRTTNYSYKPNLRIIFIFFISYLAYKLGNSGNPCHAILVDERCLGERGKQMGKYGVGEFEKP